MLDTPICRLRQIVAVIGERLAARSREQASLVQWSTQTTVQFIAATVPTAKGKPNKLLKQAQAVRLLPDDAPQGETSKDPQPGSYERFMARFGRDLERR